MTETEKRFDLSAVVPAVSDEDPFFVFDILAVAGVGIQGDGRIVFEPNGEAEGQFARGIHLARENGGQCIPGFRTAVPGLYDRRNVRYPRHGYGIAADQYHDQTAVGPGQLGDELILFVRKVVAATVGGFAVLIVFLVQPAHKDDDVGLGSFIDGLLADIGGGSSEIVLFKGNRIIENTSLPIGSLNLHSKFIKGIMPDKKEIKAIKDEINAHLSKIDNNDTFSELIGVGGTFRLIPELLANDNKVFTAHQLDNLIDCGKTDRNDLARLILKTKPERIHTALPGMMIAKEIMKKWNVSKVLTDRVSVRDGYLLRKINGGK